jgi:nucleotide-binding universal stress UspA family protein
MGFDRIVVGVDGSEAGFEALRQAIVLLSPAGRIVAVSAYDPALAAEAGWGAASLSEHLRHEAEAARDRAAEELRPLAGSETRVAGGGAFGALIDTAEDERASLVAVGSHGGGRIAGIALGSVATSVVHRAPCPVLVARPQDGGTFVRGIVAGLDGSALSAEAESVARALASRLSVPLRAVVATGGKPPAIERLRWVYRIEWDDRTPVDAIVGASHEAGLLVVGSRGLHGLTALGSVSERVAHQARCSVLIVRRAVWPAMTGDRITSSVAG